MRTSSEAREARVLVEKAPKLSREDMVAFNALFPAYLFRRAKTGEVWTTCCHKHKTLLPEGRRSQAETAAMTEPHQAEPRNSYCKKPTPNIVCPFCGTPVIVKELRFTGQRQNLWAFRRAIVFKWDGAALWALGYDGSKCYADELTCKPEMRLLGAARFQSGLVEATSRAWWYKGPFQSVQRQDGPLEKGRWRVHIPFTYCSEYGMSYDVIGRSEVSKSPFRYCQMEKFSEGAFDFEFLVAAAIYPRQIEMLMKAGLKEVVKDLVHRGVKNAAAMDWSKERPLESLGLSGQELKALLAEKPKNLQGVALYKRLSRKASMKECVEWAEGLRDIRQPLKLAKKWNIPPERLLRYLAGQVGCARNGGLAGINTALNCWTDYVDHAEKLGYALHRENVLMPKRLGEEHDRVADQFRSKQERALRKREADKRKKAEAAYAERKADLEKRYAYAADGYLIRVPESAEEIVAEGRELKHCVAGYADRHIQGTTTILFMRRAKAPNTPWLTIEMHGATMWQIHGYKNEGMYSAGGRIAPDPRVKYAAFLDPWLAWVAAGSKRTKDGRPKLPKKFKEVNAA